MDAIPFRSQDAADINDTNLHELIQVVCLTMARKLRRQHIACCVEVDRQLRFPLNRQRVIEILEQMIEDSLRVMPEGGQLDLTAVVCPRGLEIEVADSGIGFEPTFGLRLVAQSIGAMGDRRRDRSPEMRIDTLRCPQGGTARTLFIPWPAMKAAA